MVEIAHIIGGSSRLSPRRSDIMDYKGETIKLLHLVTDERFLKYLYILVNEMIAKNCPNESKEGKE